MRLTPRERRPAPTSDPWSDTDSNESDSYNERTTLSQKEQHRYNKKKASATKPGSATKNVKTSSPSHASSPSSTPGVSSVATSVAMRSAPPPPSSSQLSELTTTLCLESAVSSSIQSVTVKRGRSTGASGDCLVRDVAGAYHKETNRQHIKRALLPVIPNFESIFPTARQRQLYIKWLHSPLMVGLIDKEQALYASSLLPTTSFDVLAEVSAMLSSHDNNHDRRQQGKADDRRTKGATTVGGSKQLSKEGNSTGRRLFLSSLADTAAASADSPVLHAPQMPLLKHFAELHEKNSNNTITAINPNSTATTTACTTIPTIFRECYRLCCYCHRPVVFKSWAKHVTLAVCADNRVSKDAMAAADEECRARLYSMGAQMDFDDVTTRGGGKGKGGGGGAATTIAVFNEKVDAILAALVDQQEDKRKRKVSREEGEESAACIRTCDDVIHYANGENGVQTIDEAFIRQFAMTAGAAAGFTERFSNGKSNTDYSIALLSFSMPSSSVSRTVDTSTHAREESEEKVAKATATKGGDNRTSGSGDGHNDNTFTNNGGVNAREERDSSSLSSPSLSKWMAALYPNPATPTPRQINLYRQWLSLPVYYNVEDKVIGEMCAELMLLPFSRQTVGGGGGEWGPALWKAYEIGVGIVNDTTTEAGAKGSQKRRGGVGVEEEEEDTAGRKGLAAYAPYTPALEALITSFFNKEGESDGSTILSNLLLSSSQQHERGSSSASPSYPARKNEKGKGGKKGESGGLDSAFTCIPLVLKDAMKKQIPICWPEFKSVPSTKLSQSSSSLEDFFPMPPPVFGSAEALREHHESILSSFASIMGGAAPQTSFRRCTSCATLVTYRNVARHERGDSCIESKGDSLKQLLIHKYLYYDVLHRLFTNGVKEKPTRKEEILIRAIMSEKISLSVKNKSTTDEDNEGMCVDEDNALPRPYNKDAHATITITSAGGIDTLRTIHCFLLSSSLSSHCARREAGGNEGGKDEDTTTVLRSKTNNNNFRRQNSTKKECAAPNNPPNKRGREESSHQHDGTLSNDGVATRRRPPRVDKCINEHEQGIVADKDDEGKADNERVGSVMEKTNTSDGSDSGFTTRAAAAAVSAARAEQKRKILLAAVASLVSYDLTPPTQQGNSGNEGLNKLHGKEREKSRREGGADAEEKDDEEGTLCATNRSHKGLSDAYAAVAASRPLPMIRCCAPRYALTAVGGVPFLLGIDTCGVYFAKDKSCITLSITGVLTYVNKNRHRFSLRPPNKDTQLTVPARLEKKVMAVLWVREVFAHEEGARASLGFIDALPVGEATTIADAANATAADSGPTHTAKPPPLLSSSTTAARSLQIVTVPSEDFITAEDFVSTCESIDVCPLSALSSMRVGGSIAGGGGGGEGEASHRSAQGDEERERPYESYLASVLDTEDDGHAKHKKGKKSSASDNNEGGSAKKGSEVRKKGKDANKKLTLDAAGREHGGGNGDNCGAARARTITEGNYQKAAGLLAARFISESALPPLPLYVSDVSGLESLRNVVTGRNIFSSSSTATTTRGVAPKSGENPSTLEPQKEKLFEAIESDDSITVAYRAHDKEKDTNNPTPVNKDTDTIDTTDNGNNGTSTDSTSPAVVLTFTVSNNSSLYPAMRYYPSDDEEDGEA